MPSKMPKTMYCNARDKEFILDDLDNELWDACSNNPEYWFTHPKEKQIVGVYKLVEIFELEPNDLAASSRGLK
jgi:hypothetical protein